MDAKKRDVRPGDPAADVVLWTEVVMARGSMSPAGIVARSLEGRIELPAVAGDFVLLEAGGTAVAEGRVVRKNGRHFFKVIRLFETRPLGPEAVA